MPNLAFGAVKRITGGGSIHEVAAGQPALLHHTGLAHLTDGWMDHHIMPDRSVDMNKAQKVAAGQRVDAEDI